MAQTTQEKYLFAPRLAGSVYQSLLDDSVTFRRNSSTVIPREDILKAMHKRNIFLSSKQVPSALVMRKTGSVGLKRHCLELLRLGFPIAVNSDGSWCEVEPSSVYDSGMKKDTESLQSTLKSMLNSNSRPEDFISHQHVDDEETQDEMSVHSHESDDEESDLDGDDLSQYQFAAKLQYVDPFVAHAAKEIAARTGRSGPNLVVWQGDIVRLTDPIPYPILQRYGYKSRGRRACRFVDIASESVKHSILLNQTHWGNRIKKMIWGPEADTPSYEREWAKKLWKMLKHFLRGTPNPLHAADKREMSPEKVPERERSSRLLQVLKTIDGVFAQKYLAYPDMNWTWQRYDNFVLGLIWMLLPDEFYSKEIPMKLGSYTTAYELLQATRKRFKDHFNRDDLGALINETKSMPTPIHKVFLAEWERLHGELDAYYRIQVAGILGQKRGTGTPPSLVATRSKIKFLNTVSNPVLPLDKWTKAELEKSMDEILKSVPDEAFTGLRTKAGVTVSTNACFEKTREEGGTAQAINALIHEGICGRQIRVIDLETGAFIELKYLTQCTTGEFIFWRCLEETLATPLDVLRTAFAVGVQEPGKTRVITKSAACLKIVLDLVHGITAWPLGKLPSSESGMTRDNHGWNFRGMLFQHPEIVFNEQEVSDVVDSDGFTRTVVYKPAYVSSTDYNTATDFTHHEVAKVIGVRWMHKCGIPAVLRGVVNAICFQPRKIVFTAHGCLKPIGKTYDDEHNYVLLRRGILMGDPLTKVILHLINIMVRTTSRRFERAVQDSYSGPG